MYVKLKRNKIFWHYVLKSGNGQVLSTSENYFSKSNAIRAAQKLASIVGAKVKE